MENFYKDKCVFITGAAGTLGCELVKQLALVDKARKVIAIDNNETELFFLAQQFQTFKNIEFYLVDVRDEDKLTQKMNGVDVVIHAAAYKHVVFCEESPDEAIKTNIMGVQNVIASANKNNARWLVFTSTDKAVNPTSVMGTSKLMGERIITAASRDFDKSGLILASARFGNILGSRGSVMPIFYEQIRRGLPLTLTDKSMTRFVMTVGQAAKLILDSVPIAKGGEVFVTKMPVIKISDLAEIMIEQLAQQFGHAPQSIPINIIGMKPGEKMYEELMAEQEVERAIDIGKYFIVLPSFKQEKYDFYIGQTNTPVSVPYNSANSTPLSKPELLTFLNKHNLLTDVSGQYQPSERFFFVA